MSRVLVIDDEASICWAFREFLGDLGHEVLTAASAEQGMELAEQSGIDAVVLDVRLPGQDGLTAMGRLRERVGPVPIIVITAFGNLETAVRAMQAGAFEYLVKPFDLDQASSVLARALESRRGSRSAPSSRLSEPAADASGALLIGRSPRMQELFKQIALVAPTDVPVLITGESGTGKEEVARAIHRHSSRGGKTFLPVCLAALSSGLVERELFGHLRGSFTGAIGDRKGLLELAEGGTVLLDEIGDVSPDVQVKLLRAIEQREVTPVGDARPRPIGARFLAATNRPLDQLIAAGEFREDLYYRLSVFPIEVPPLRERTEDIPLLAAHFLKQLSLPAGSGTVRDDVIDALVVRPWLGNVRELRNAIERAAIVARGREIRPEHLPSPVSPRVLRSEAASREGIQHQLSRWVDAECDEDPGTGPDASDGSLHDRFLALVEPPFLEAMLRRSQGNRAVAAQQIGIHRATLRQKLRRYGLE